MLHVSCVSVSSAGGSRPSHQNPTRRSNILLVLLLNSPSVSLSLRSINGSFCGFVGCLRICRVLNSNGRQSISASDVVRSSEQRRCGRAAPARRVFRGGGFPSDGKVRRRSVSPIENFDIPETTRFAIYFRVTGAPQTQRRRSRWEDLRGPGQVEHRWDADVLASDAR